MHQPQLFPISILQKQLKIHLLFEMSPKYGCNNLYYHPFNLPKAYKLFSYLTSRSHRGPVNPSTPTFGNMNLIETMTNLIVAWKFSQKRTQEALFAP